jgi:hypothetical protein
MRKLEFRTEAVLKAIGGISQFSTAFDAMADLVLILTRKDLSFSKVQKRNLYTLHSVAQAVG